MNLDKGYPNVFGMTWFWLVKKYVYVCVYSSIQIVLLSSLSKSKFLTSALFDSSIKILFWKEKKTKDIVHYNTLDGFSLPFGELGIKI